MAAVRVVVNFRVKPGRYADLFEGLRAVKRHIERMGSIFVVNRQAFGPEAGNIVVVVQHADWATHARVASDTEFVQLLESMRNNPDPAWESITPVIYEEVAL